MMQDHDALVSARRLGQLAGSAETAPRTADVQAAKPLVHCNPFGPNRGKESFPRQAEALAVELKAELVVRGHTVADEVDERPQSRNVLQQFDKPLNVADAMS